ncbi:MAG: hypothetical protein WB992_13435, partial [Bryobacteraceae bacterium]
MVFLKPFRGQTPLPRTDGYIDVVIRKAGDLLDDEVSLEIVLEAFGKVLLKSLPANPAETEASQEQQLNSLAEYLRVSPGKLDVAIKNLKVQATDPYKKALAAFYSHEYSVAERFSAASQDSSRAKTSELRNRLADATELRAQALFT